jgi:beta-lactamase regulating signal transducer with metallopeptidase domain
MNSVINSGMALRLSLTLMHSLWQGAAISLMAGAVAGALSRSAAALRYQIFFVALVLCALAAALTFARLSPGPDAPLGPIASSIPTRAAAAVETHQPTSPASSTGVAPIHIVGVEPSTSDSPPVKSRFDWTPYATLVVELYAAGVTLMLLRLSIAIRGDRRLRIAARPLIDQEILVALHRQTARLGLSFVPAVFHSARVLVPTVVGILRPAILLPVSVSTGLSADAIEAILAHELGHIRRYDHLLQLVQRLIEAAFFFHPAVWYLSSRIHVERENACDDLAVRVFHQPRDYANALLQAAEFCTFARRPAAVASLTMANRPGGLRRRVARLLEPTANSRFRLPGVCTATVLLILALVLALGLHYRANAAGPAAPTTRPGDTPSGATSPESHGEKVYPLPSNSNAVDKAVSPENFKAFASRTTDPEVLLGLAYLAPTGSPVRPEISQSAANARPEFAPIVAVLSIAMDGANEQSVAELIKTDPDNALGYFLQANRLYEAGKEKESLDLFQKAATCPELRLYGTTTANALFKALDALNLHGRDRLAASSWTATRMSNFYISDLQPLARDLNEMSVKADPASRKEISDLLFILGGHLYATNFENREFGEWAVRDAFRLKAEIAAVDKSPEKNGYFAASAAIFGKQVSWPPADEPTVRSLDVVQFLPGRISGAFEVANGFRGEPTSPMGIKLRLSESDRAVYEKAQADYVKAANALIDVSVSDGDGIVGAYLKDLPPPDKRGSFPWISSYSYVEKLIYSRPDVLKAAIANESAMRWLENAGGNDLGVRNVNGLMLVDEAIWAYASDHNQILPSGLEVLYKDGKYLKDASQTKSLLTGKTYIYPAAGMRFPEKSAERESFIVVYDGDEVDGRYLCATGSGGGAALPADVFKELLRKQGK